MEVRKVLKPPETGRGKKRLSPGDFSSADNRTQTCQFQTSGLQNGEKTNFNCFKPSSLWYLLQQPQEINTPSNLNSVPTLIYMSFCSRLRRTQCQHQLSANTCTNSPPCQQLHSPFQHQHLHHSGFLAPKGVSQLIGKLIQAIVQWI